MKKTWGMLLGLAVVLALVAGVSAADEKEKTLKGSVCCAKCELKVDGQKACHTVIVVEDKDKKKVTYWFDADASKKYHKPICMEPMKGTVVGVVDDKDTKKITIKVSKCDLDK